MLTVYLDTQDYINIFNEPDGGENRKILDILLRFRDDGHLVIGFSAITLLEFITEPDDNNREERVRRGRLIKNICGKNAFPMIVDLGSGARFPNGGNWLLAEGNKLISASKVLRDLCEYYKSEVNKLGGNRNQRRKLLKQLALEKLVLKNGFGRNISDYGNIPVSREFVEGRYIEKLILGKISHTEFEKVANSFLIDPEEYSRIVYDHYKKQNMIDLYFGKVKEDIKTAVDKFQNHMSTIKLFNSAVTDARAKLIESGRDKKEVRSQLKSVPVIDEFPNRLVNLEKNIGEGRSEHFVHYFRKLQRLSLKYKESDLMDLWQLCYAYDCDFFRCDKAMADSFKDFKPFEGKLVGRFSDLPTRIKEKLSEASY